jgi:S1/P1 Nuclease
MKNYALVATLVAITLSSELAYSWGSEGHQTVALVAQSILKSQSQNSDVVAAKTLDTINTILGSTAISDAATWPDEVKELSRACTQAPYVKDPNYGSAAQKGKSSAICDAYKYTASWHFTSINADQGQTEYSYPSKVAPSPTARIPYGDGDLVIIIKGLAHILRGESAPTLDGATSYANWKTQCLNKTDHNCKKEALEFLIHFVGDIHQPLHSGPHCDIGGNSQYITFFGQSVDPAAYWCNGKSPCNNHELHQAWDATLLVKNVYVAGNKPPVPASFSTTYAANLISTLTGQTASSDSMKCMKTAPNLAITQDNIDEQNGANNGPIAWANESACYFPQVYSFPDDQGLTASKKKAKRAVAQSLNSIPNLCDPARKTGTGYDQAFTAFSIGQKYYDANMPVINERLYWAGARLANVLKYVYGSGDKVQGEIQ